MSGEKFISDFILGSLDCPIFILREQLYTF